MSGASVVSSVAPDGVGSTGLSQSEVDARVVAVAPTANSALQSGPASCFVVGGTIDDDDFLEIEMPNGDVSCATLQIATSNNGKAGCYAFRPRSGPWILEIAASGFDTTTGAMDGETGTDGNVTISPTGSNTLHIENRQGSGLFVVCTIGVIQ